MIKLSATNAKGRKLILLGLTEDNITRMREDKPVHVHGEELNLPGFEIFLIVGKDEAALQAQLSPLIGPNTQVRDHRDKKKSRH